MVVQPISDWGGGALEGQRLAHCCWRADPALARQHPSWHPHGAPFSQQSAV